MESQSFSNHVRVHPLYHYFAVPVSLALIAATLVNLFINFSLASIVLLVAMIILHLTIFLTRDYAKKNQDRIIRAELRLRYYLLTQQNFEDFENHYSAGQLLALRFASDEEFINFINNTETKNLSPEEIKKQIKYWKADWMRV